MRSTHFCGETRPTGLTSQGGATALHITDANLAHITNLEFHVIRNGGSEYHGA
jgi:hypothetical protein